MHEIIVLLIAINYGLDSIPEVVAQGSGRCAMERRSDETT
jgi:hypothetical protein